MKRMSIAKPHYIVYQKTYIGVHVDGIAPCYMPFLRFLYYKQCPK